MYRYSSINQHHWLMSLKSCLLRCAMSHASQIKQKLPLKTYDNCIIIMFINKCTNLHQSCPSVWLVIMIYEGQSIGKTHGHWRTETHRDVYRQTDGYGWTDGQPASQPARQTHRQTHRHIQNNEKCNNTQLWIFWPILKSLFTPTWNIAGNRHINVCTKFLKMLTTVEKQAKR